MVQRLQQLIALELLVVQVLEHYLGQFQGLIAPAPLDEGDVDEDLEDYSPVQVDHAVQKIAAGVLAQFRLRVQDLQGGGSVKVFAILQSLAVPIDEIGQVIGILIGHTRHRRKDKVSARRYPRHCAGGRTGF